MSAGSDYEYEYSDEEDYPVQESDDDSMEEDMEWAGTAADGAENPNAAPMMMDTYGGKGKHAHTHTLPMHVWCRQTTDRPWRLSFDFPLPSASTRV